MAEITSKLLKNVNPGQRLDDRPLRGRGGVPGGWDRGTKKVFSHFFQNTIPHG